jgi:4-amino-4-deoxy-L-arabinose transferase-like glycosyltransferase
VASITGKLNEWAIRLPSVISALLSLGATVWLGRKLWSEKVGRTAGWMMLTSYGFLMWARRGKAFTPAGLR